MAAESLGAWVDRLQSGGRYCFVRDEAVRGSGLSPEAVKKALQRLARRGRVAKLKDYFYVIVPLEYAAAGCPPRLRATLCSGICAFRSRCSSAGASPRRCSCTR